MPLPQGSGSFKVPACAPVADDPCLYSGGAFREWAVVLLLSKSKLPLTAHQCRVQTRNTFLVFSQMEMVNSLYVCSALQVSIDLPASPSKFGSTAMLVQRWGLACLIWHFFLCQVVIDFYCVWGIKRISNCHTSHTWSLVICCSLGCFFSYPLLC